MSNVAKLGDACFGVCVHPDHSEPYETGGVISSVSSTFMDTGIPISKVGDIVTSTCGHIGIIVTGGSLVLDGQLIARNGDLFSGVYSGNIVGATGSLIVD